MKQAFSKMLPLAAILMAGVAMVACSVEKQPTETVEPSPKKMLSLTIDASLDGGATRSLNIDGEERLSAIWKEGEKVEIYGNIPFQGEGKIGELTASNITNEGRSATLSGAVDVSSGVPMTLRMYLNRRDDSFLFYLQDGTLDGPAGAEKFEMAKAEVSLSTYNDEELFYDGPATFVSQTAVAKFTFKNGRTPIQATRMQITARLTFSSPDVVMDEGDILDVNFSTPNNGVIYLALPVRDVLAKALKSKDILIQRTLEEYEEALSAAELTIKVYEGEKEYTTTKTGYNFAAGKYYAAQLKWAGQLRPGDYYEAHWDDDNTRVYFTEETRAENEYKVLDGTTVTSITEGWYVVKDNVTISGKQSLTGDTFLILCDGATLTINNEGEFAGNGHALTIYAQDEGTGRLNIIHQTIDKNHTVFSALSKLSIHGGNLHVTADGATHMEVLSRIDVDFYGGRFEGTVIGGDMYYNSNAEDHTFNLYGGIFRASSNFFVFNGQFQHTYINLKGATVESVGGNQSFYPLIGITILNDYTIYHSEVGFEDALLHGDGTVDDLMNTGTTNKVYFIIKRG